MDTGPCQLFVKLDNQNPTGSIKGRVALAMIEAAERDGRPRPGATVIEATAGNTGLGLALIAAAHGFRVMAYAVPARTAWNPGEIPFFVSVCVAAAQEITGFWEKLSVGAAIKQPLAPSGWMPLHGMLKDRFGVT